MEKILSTIHAFLFMGTATLFLFQSFFLFIRSKNNKARRTMAILDLLWGLIYGLTLLGMVTHGAPNAYPLLRDNVLILGGFCIMFTNFFPIQVLLPGWLNWKRAFLLNLPILAMTCIYYGGRFLFNESSEHLMNFTAIWASIGHFNVWFRLIMLLINMAYLAFILKWLYKYEKRYIQWKNENFSDQEYVDISWMRSYDYIVIGITIFYLGILLIGGQATIICHCLFVLFSFSYLFYKILFYENPYPEDFFASNRPSVVVTGGANEYNLPTSSEIEVMNEQAFENKIQIYTEKLKTWMEEEKPYLFNDFKLTDVSRILPLNRTYLSRVFNEGFGQNFSEVVRIYRVNYSKDILKKSPSLPMHKVAELCGFRSDSTYTKAFKQVTGITPSQYKAEGE